MNTIHLHGADAQRVADLMGGTLIMVNETDGTAMIAGGDVTKAHVVDTDGYDR